ncbi:MAG: glycosyltransferase involved in cell wall biosynthesis [Vicingaceae bacterium]
MENFGESILIKNKVTLDDVGVVIPTYNEALYLPKLVTDLNKIGFTNMCIVDAGSTDETLTVAKSLDVLVFHSDRKNRAFQMNLGAQQLQVEYYLFIHADVRFTNLNESFFLERINAPNFSFGNFKLCFDSSHWFLKLNEKFSHLKFGAFQFGDQGLLIRKAVFEAVKGFEQQLLFMEGNDIIRRLRQDFKFVKMEAKLLVSARKYDEVGVYRLQFSYFLIYSLARMGVSQEKIKQRFTTIFGAS